MMRAVRYSTRFGFPIEPHTMAAIFELAHTLLPSVAMERIWQEFKKMSQFEHFDTGLVMLHDLGLLPTIFPELKACSSYEIRDRVKFIPAFPKHVPTIAELLELFPDASLEQAFLLCEKLKLSRHEKEFVDFYIKSKKLLNFPVDWKTRLEPIEWAYFYASPFSNTVLNIEACRLPENEKNNFIQAQIEHRAQLEPAIQRIICKNPVVKAEHLMAAGVLPGKKMGLLLKEAEKIAINQKMEDPQAIINILKKLLIW
jgi:poly(A) polymerase